MLNNDVLRSVRYLLDINDASMAEMVQQLGFNVAPSDMSAYLKRDDEPDFKVCGDEVLAHFLNALVVFKRGRDDSRPPQSIELPMSNNQILKKMRVAFELKDDDLQDIFRSVDFALSKAELSALFRKAGHSNYRVCGDQLLRYFLKGLTLRERPAG
ncbi:DUF1456 family protein [Atopomonas sediminilitoris]|uniref:DUF1456 family protein n=1 Tax=Atopomonas sediminilitoris TaxID=2919919 RepID=UPI001F4DABAE|nr:DUF1456 family protein [Atopomonas sediminilitoris]MCJ8168422.1 DUF1456 family protein [Atopomonas sediminilitoris]